MTTSSLAIPNQLGLQESTRACCQLLRNLPALGGAQCDPKAMRVEALPSPLAAASRSHFPRAQGRGLHLPGPPPSWKGTGVSTRNSLHPEARTKTRTQASAEVIMQSGGQEVDRELRRSRSACFYWCAWGRMHSTKTSTVYMKGV